MAAYAVHADLERHRYEVTIDDHLAGFLDFTLSNEHIALNHTEVVKAFRGRGVARRLDANALTDAGLCELAVVPVCPYVRRVIELMPDQYLDLVRSEDQERFELAHRPSGQHHAHGH